MTSSTEIHINSIIILSLIFLLHLRSPRQCGHQWWVSLLRQTPHPLKVQKKIWGESAHHNGRWAQNRFLYDELRQCGMSSLLLNLRYQHDYRLATEALRCYLSDHLILWHTFHYAHSNMIQRFITVQNKPLWTRAYSPWPTWRERPSTLFGLSWASCLAPLLNLGSTLMALKTAGASPLSEVHSSPAKSNIALTEAQSKATRNTGPSSACSVIHRQSLIKHWDRM